MGDERIDFASKDDEIKYWKDLAAQYLEEIDRVQKDADEFASESQQLEREYETTIEQNEKKIRELTLAASRAYNEVESLKAKLDESNKHTMACQLELDQLKREKYDMAQYIRELEQKNDDLERSRRYVEENIAAIEAAFNAAIERNALLESEVDEKELMRERLQRLADETKELKQELHVKERHIDDRSSSNSLHKSTTALPPPLAPTPAPAPAVLDSNRLKEIETQTTPTKRDHILPASRVVALNLVSDLIRKVGNLERKLDKGRYDYKDPSGDVEFVSCKKRTGKPSNKT